VSVLTLMLPALLLSLPAEPINMASSDDKRWEGVSRVYTREDVEKLRGSLKIEHTLARHGAERLWKLLHSEPYVHALGALTGNQAVQQVQGETACTAPPPF
jgi:isocitrate lyase